MINNLLHIRNQSVPRSKHFPPVIKTNQLMIKDETQSALYKESVRTAQ
jgi:hypothetical protein